MSLESGQTLRTTLTLYCKFLFKCAVGRNCDETASLVVLRFDLYGTYQIVITDDFDMSDFLLILAVTMQHPTKVYQWKDPVSVHLFTFLFFNTELNMEKKGVLPK